MAFDIMAQQAANNPKTHALAFQMGFTGVDHTGGNCRAYHRTLRNGCYAWLTDEDGCSLPTDTGLEAGEDACLGVYNSAGEALSYHYGPLAEMPGVIGGMIEAAAA
jgi:hypothetical protein